MHPLALSSPFTLLTLQQLVVISLGCVIWMTFHVKRGLGLGNKMLIMQFFRHPILSIKGKRDKMKGISYSS